MIYTWNLDPIAFSFSGLEVRWYGLAYLAGFFLMYHLGWWVFETCFKDKKNKLTKSDFENLVLGGFLIGILGGRIGYFLFYNTQTLIEDPLQLIKIWEGGMSIHGGILAVLVYGLWWCKRYQQSFMTLADSFALPLALTLFLGRLANFINGELIGRPTDQTWGVIFPHIDELLRHPSQLYEAGKNLVIASIILFVLWKYKPKRGTLFLILLFGYGGMRFLIEYVREPNFYVGPLTMGQVLCLLMVVLGSVLLFQRKK